MKGSVGVDLEMSGLDDGIVRPDVLDKRAALRVNGVGDHDPIKGPVLRSDPSQPDLNQMFVSVGLAGKMPGATLIKLYLLSWPMRPNFFCILTICFMFFRISSSWRMS